MPTAQRSRSESRHRSRPHLFPDRLRPRHRPGVWLSNVRNHQPLAGSAAWPEYVAGARFRGHRSLPCADHVAHLAALCVAVFPEAASVHFAEERKQTLQLAILWLISAMVVDFVGFVLIKNAWSMTPHELYVEYQPWITLIYISIFLSPWIRLWLSRWRTAASSKRLASTS